MRKEEVLESPEKSAPAALKAVVEFRKSFLVLFCMVALLFCTTTIAIPLQRLPHNSEDLLAPILRRLPINPLLSAWGAWLPTGLQLAPFIPHSGKFISILELQLFAILSFTFYLLAAWFIAHQPVERDQRLTHRIIWIGAICIGSVFLLTPALTSYDVTVYADYGHVLTAYGANPYFVPPSHASHDFLTLLNDWRSTTFAYGPVWLSLCALISLLCGDHFLHYLFAYRLLALLFHLLNIGLVTTILSRARCSSRTVTLGTVLYAWNPLILLESALDVHNDIYICTLILSGILLSIRANQLGFLHPRNYLPPLIAFTLAVMIKITAAPLVACFLLLLACKAMRTNVGHLQLSRWRQALQPVAMALVVSLGISLLLYMPFWFGHSIPQIITTFTSPPSSQQGVNSVFRVFADKAKKGLLPASSSWQHLPTLLLSQRSTWNIIDLLTLAGALAFAVRWLWRKPSVSALALVMLAAQASLLVVIPWFYPWYILEPVVLLPIIFIEPLTAVEKNLFVFVLTLSLTGLLSEFNTVYFLSRFLSVYAYMPIFIPPLCLFLISWLFNRWRGRGYRGASPFRPKEAEPSEKNSLA